MTQITNGHIEPTNNDLFGGAVRLRIAQLALGQPEPDSLPYVEAVISLLWPYSNNTDAISLLLAEPDVRLRSAKGQLKVTFHGEGAKQIARTHVGIGDYVRLRLDHSTWTYTGESVSTPGKKVEWDLHFKNRVVLDIIRDGSLLGSVDFQREYTPPPTLTADSTQNGQIFKITGAHRNDVIVFDTPLSSTKPIRLSSGSFVDATLDPFADDDGFIVGKGRKKTKFGRTSGSWRLIDDVADSEVEEPVEIENLPSTSHTNGLTDVITLNDDVPTEPHVPSFDMPPPETPFRKPSTKLSGTLPDNDKILTPRLHPLPSPGLPLVSPLIKNQNARFDYFGVQHSGSSELDAISISSSSPTDLTFSTRPRLTDAIQQDGLEQTRNDDSEAESAPREKQTPSFTEDMLGSPRLDHPPMFGESPQTPPFESILENSAGASFISSPFASPTYPTPIPPPLVAAATNQSTNLTSAVTIELAPLHVVGTDAEDHWGNRTTLVDSTDGLEVSNNYISQSSPNQLSIANCDQDESEGKEEQQGLDADEDMYGPARSTASIPVDANPSVKDSSLYEWRDTANKTTDNAGTRISESPFLSSQAQRRKSDKELSQEAPSLDGVSDETSEAENINSGSGSPRSSGSNMSEDYREEIEDVQTEGSHGPGSVKSILSLRKEPTQSFENITKAHMALGPVLELEGVPSRQMGTKVANGNEIAYFDKDDNDSVIERGKQVQVAGNTFLDETRRNATQRKVESQVVEERSARRQQILTPENTQAPGGDTSSFETIEQVTSIQMPPTPDNTQEPSYMPKLDDTDDLHSIEDDTTTSVFPSAEKRIVTRSSQQTSEVQGPLDSSPLSYKVGSLSPARHAVASLTQDHRDELQERMEPSVLSPSDDKPFGPAIGMSTALSYYTPLTSLAEHFDQRVDVLTVCTSDTDVPERSKAGPKDYYTTLHLADTFSDDATTVTAQIFRPYKKALPIVRRGQVLLLRSFKVQSLKRKMALLSTDSSAWAVFSSPDGPLQDDDTWRCTVEIPGPPVEYGSDEIGFVRELMIWWNSVGSDTHRVIPSKDVDKIILSGASEPRSKALPLSTAVDPKQDNSVIESSIPGTKTSRKETEPHSSHPNPSIRATRASNRLTHQTSSTEIDQNTQVRPAMPSAVDEPTSPTSIPQSRRKVSRKNDTDSSSGTKDAHEIPPISPTRFTRSMRRLSNVAETSMEVVATDSTEPLTGDSGTNTRRRPRQFTPAISPGPEQPRNLRSQLTVHELRDGTKYVDGHVPTKKDGIHELRDGTKYVDENVSSTMDAEGGNNETASQEPEDGDGVDAVEVVHQLRDGTSYVDRGEPVQSPPQPQRELRRRSARNSKRQGRAA